MGERAQTGDRSMESNCHNGTVKTNWHTDIGTHSEFGVRLV